MATKKWGQPEKAKTPGDPLWMGLVVVLGLLAALSGVVVWRATRPVQVAVVVPTPLPAWMTQPEPTPVSQAAVPTSAPQVAPPPMENDPATRGTGE